MHLTWIDETRKRNQSHISDQRSGKGHFMSKCPISLLPLKMVLVLQIKTQDYHTWSVESRNLATYRMFRDKDQRPRIRWTRSLDGQGLKVTSANIYVSFQGRNTVLIIIIIIIIMYRPTRLIPVHIINHRYRNIFTCFTFNGESHNCKIN